MSRLDEIPNLIHPLCRARDPSPGIVDECFSPTDTTCKYITLEWDNLRRNPCFLPRREHTCVGPWKTVIEKPPTGFHL